MRKAPQNEPFLYEDEETCVETTNKEFAILVMKYAQKKSKVDFDEAIFDLEELVAFEDALEEELEDN